jgi:hypothetical protein
MYDGEKWVIELLTTLKKWLSHLHKPYRWKNELGRSRFSHDGTQIGWKPHKMGRIP